MKDSGGRTAFTALIIGFLAVAVYAIVIFARHIGSRPLQNGAAISNRLTLPFTIACAIDSSDAEPVYTALTKHDREVLSELFASKKFVAVNKGLAVRISNFGNVSMITIDARPPHPPGICFVPSYVVGAIRRHASR